MALKWPQSGEADSALVGLAPLVFAAGEACLLHDLPKRLHSLEPAAGRLPQGAAVGDVEADYFCDRARTMAQGPGETAVFRLWRLRAAHAASLTARQRSHSVQLRFVPGAQLRERTDADNGWVAASSLVPGVHRPVQSLDGPCR